MRNPDAGGKKKFKIYDFASGRLWRFDPRQTMISLRFK
jgi:hypothetical protein